MDESQEFCKVLSSAQGMVIALTHSQQLWLPARDQAYQFFFSRGRGEA